MGYLIIDRRVGEKILIGKDIEISISKITGNRVDIAISAPKDLSIKRGELEEEDENGKSS